MFTIEEKKELRNQFWNKFKSYSNKRKLKDKKTGKWIMDNTGIKQLKLKFHCDEQLAWAGIEIDSNNMDKRIDLFDKLEKLKTILTEAVPHELIWELEEEKAINKSVSRVYAIKQGVNIYDQNSWKKIFAYLYSVMDPIEDVFQEYFDFIKYQ